jgi:hypothetical protein
MKSSPAFITKAAILGLFLVLSPAAFAANVVVPSMDLITHGAVNSHGVFALETFGDVTLDIQGGYKFGGNLSVGIDESSLELASSTPLDFRSASIIIRDLFDVPLSFSYFVGENDTFGSGDGFSQFGAQPFMTAYRGFLYFPTGPLYNGIYQVNGTGGKIEFAPDPQALSMDLYVYEDTSAGLSLGDYSSDLRVLLNFEAIKVEGFVGGTYASSAGDYSLRGGILFYATNRNVEFLAQIGIPRWAPGTDPVLNVNLIYLLIEPRLHLGFVTIVPTFFWHPGYYNQVYYSTELGAFDVNLNVTLGDLTKNALQGGLEENFRFQSYTGAFQFKVSPWIGFSTPGVLWTVKVNAKLWPFSLTDLVDAFVGIQASF